MAKNASDNLSEETGIPTSAQPGATPVPWSQNRCARAIPNNDEIDTFSTPSESPADENPIPITGTEPAVFGGINPEAPLPATESPATVVAGETSTEPLAAEQAPNPLEVEDPLSAQDLLGEAPRINFVKIVRSVPFLGVLMVLCLAAATMFIQSSVKTVTFVEMVIKFANYTGLDDEQVKALQLEINELLRSYPLRSDAWDILQKKDSGMSPGFLNSGLTFHRFDSIVWEKDGRMVLRIDSDDPPTDLIRLSTIADAFYSAAQTRNKQLEANRASLQSAEALEPPLMQRDAILKQQADDLLPDAQRYTDLKAALQGTERYLGLAEESNPLRLVARENLRILAAQVGEARKAAEKHDELVTTRVETQRELADLRKDIASLHRKIDSFSYPLPPDAKAMSIVDTRSHRASILRDTWIGIVAVFLGLMWSTSHVSRIFRKSRPRPSHSRKNIRRATIMRRHPSSAAPPQNASAVDGSRSGDIA